MDHSVSSILEHLNGSAPPRKLMISSTKITLALCQLHGMLHARMLKFCILQKLQLETASVRPTLVATTNVTSQGLIHVRSILTLQFLSSLCFLHFKACPAVAQPSGKHRPPNRHSRLFLHFRMNHFPRSQNFTLLYWSENPKPVWSQDLALFSETPPKILASLHPCENNTETRVPHQYKLDF